MSGSDEQRKPTPQDDLMALLSNPDALRLLAFGARTMGRVVDTGREIGKVAGAFAPGAFVSPPPASGPAAADDPAPVDDDEPAGTARQAPPDDHGPDERGSAGPGDAEPRPVPVTAVPEGSMLVPVEAWNRVLDQLGNIHQAGQELAEARERAARAEAVAEFQTERRLIAEAEAARLATELIERDAPDPTRGSGPRPSVYSPPLTARRLTAKVTDWLRR